jgi:hypothetical protein
MPFVMSYTDPGTVVHPNSYWIAGAISYNAIERIGQVIYQGYHDKDSYDAGDGQVAGSPRAFATTDPALFFQYFGNAKRIFSGLSFQEWLDSFAQNEDPVNHFFEIAVPYVDLDVPIVDIGSVNKTTLWVGFGDDVTSQSVDYSLGMIIRVNATPVTPAVAAKQAGTFWIYFTIAAVDADDIVDWEYDSSVGDLIDNGGMLLQSIGRTTALNMVGAFRWFNVAENSGLIATV